MNTIDERISAFREYCARNRYKVTAERISLLHKVCSIDGHFDAEDLLIQMRNEGNRVSRATIYRTLDLFVEMGILSRERMGGNQYLYECILDRATHYHTICTSCGRIEEFTHRGIRNAVKQAAADSGFVPQTYTLEIFGVCRTCAMEDD